MSNLTPKVTIGLPVYNGSNFIRASVDSILNQSFQDFELIICDNASTDGTRKICEQFVRADTRVRYYRNERNFGAARNFNRVFELSSGTYFKWMAHDDLLGPTYLEYCAAYLDAHPAAVVCHASTARIDADDEVTSIISHDTRTASHEVHERFADLLNFHTRRQQIFGLIRSDVLAQTRLMEGFADADGNLLVELSLRGKIVELPEVLFFLRSHPQQSTKLYPNPMTRVEWFDTRQTGKMSFPAWRGLWGYNKSLWRVNLNFADRLRCYAVLIRWLVQRRLRVLGGEVKFNAMARLSNMNEGRVRAQRSAVSRTA